MITVTLTRLNDDTKQTLGVLSFTKLNGQLYVCKTLELPWKNNTASKSCIPLGTYPCKYTQSARMTVKKGQPVFTYEVLNVRGRAGIRIHSANYFHDLLGCIALGDANADIDGDGETDILHSAVTIAAFEQLLNHQDFTLVIQ